MAWFFNRPTTKAGTVPRQRGKIRWSARTAWVVAALVVFVVSTFVALTQAPHPDPFRPASSLLSLDGWRYPIERNAFNRLPSITSDLRDVFALPDTELLWAVGDKGVIVHSTDGGQTWSQQPIGTVVPNTPAPQSSGHSGSWELIPTAHAAAKKESQPVAPKTPKAVTKPAPPQSPPASQRALPKRAPPPSKVEPPPPLQTRDLYAVYFIDAQRGWAVGSGGTILTTDNGGQQWQAQSSGTKASLSAVRFANAQRGWAVGEGGTILITDNGGTTWRSPAYGRGLAPWYYLSVVRCFCCYRPWHAPARLRRRSNQLPPC